MVAVYVPRAQRGSGCDGHVARSRLAHAGSASGRSLKLTLLGLRGPCTPSATSAMASLISLTCSHTLLRPCSQHVPRAVMPNLQHETTRAARDAAAELGSDGAQERTEARAAILGALQALSMSFMPCLGIRVSAHLDLAVSNDLRGHILSLFEQLLQLGHIIRHEGPLGPPAAAEAQVTGPGPPKSLQTGKAAPAEGATLNG